MLKVINIHTGTIVAQYHIEKTPIHPRGLSPQLQSYWDNLSEQSKTNQVERWKQTCAEVDARNSDRSTSAQYVVSRLNKDATEHSYTIIDTGFYDTANDMNVEVTHS